MTAPVETVPVARDEDGLRLDRWFKQHFPDLTYGHLQKLLRSGQIRVDSKRAQSNTRLASGQRIRVPKSVREPPAAKPSLKPPPGVSKADRTFIENLILFEDESVLVRQHRLASTPSLRSGAGSEWATGDTRRGSGAT